MIYRKHFKTTSNLQSVCIMIRTLIFFTLVIFQTLRAGDFESYYHISEKNKFIYFIVFTIPKHETFEDFMNYIAAENVNDKCADVHIRSQSSLLPEGLDFIGRYENLENDLKFILKKLGVENQPIFHLNKTKHSHYS